MCKIVGLVGSFQEEESLHFYLEHLNLKMLFLPPKISPHQLIQLLVMRTKIFHQFLPQIFWNIRLIRSLIEHLIFLRLPGWQTQEFHYLPINQTRIFIKIFALQNQNLVLWKERKNCPDLAAIMPS